MGIPRFYRWLKERYPLIRMDLTDPLRCSPPCDNLYIDFNALIYQCIRQSNCFLKQKIQPIPEDQIGRRVIGYLLQLVRTANPQKMVFIALDGVAPRAKINQSRDRRFRAAKDDIQFFQQLLAEMGLPDSEKFQTNSISPGTRFLHALCQRLKASIVQLMAAQWSDLLVMFSDCGVPGQGEHKIMDFLRYAHSIQLFPPQTTHCVYSPDADVILLCLSLNLKHIWIIKEDTSKQPSPSWTATSTYRKSQAARFQLVLIGVLRQYMQQEFNDVLAQVPGSHVNDVIDDFVLLMAFVGNDFLPTEFCFSIKETEMNALFGSYKKYLSDTKQFINRRGKIDWGNIHRLLELACHFQANRIRQMKAQYRNKVKPKEQGIFDQQQPQAGQSQIQQFDVQDDKIVKGLENYYQSRFGVSRNNTAEFKKIVLSYIQGLEFYCRYYYLGLPSWSWFFPYHYTPLLCDVRDYIRDNPVNITLDKSQPFQPILALLFMIPQRNFGLIPAPYAKLLSDPKGPLAPYFPSEFKLDPFETLKYNRHALIPFLPEKQVIKLYKSVPKDQLTAAQQERNQYKSTVLYIPNDQAFTGMELQFNGNFQQQLKKVVKPFYNDIPQQRFMPSLKQYGPIQINQKGRVVCQAHFKPQDQPVFFNDFVGFVQSSEPASPELAQDIRINYTQLGLSGTPQQIYTLKRARAARQAQGIRVYPTKQQVIVPDFAISRPAYDYLPKNKDYNLKQLYRVGERVVVLSNKYFGCRGRVHSLSENQVSVRLVEDPVKSQSKIQQNQQEFYSLSYVLNQLQISAQNLLGIISEVIVLPVMPKKKDFNEKLPTAINFGLNFVQITADKPKASLKIVPRFVRCNLSYQDTRNPPAMLEGVQVSESGLKILKQWVNMYAWLVQLMQGHQNGRIRKEFKASQAFPNHKNPNIHLYCEFVKLYSLDNKGVFSSPYSKISQQQLPQFHTQKKSQQAIVTLPYSQIFSRKQALLAPPAYRSQPQYHNIGARVVLLKALEVGYVVAIDDTWVHVVVGKELRKQRVHFIDLFSQGWQMYLATTAGKCWNLQVSYYSPSYWKKAITQ